MNRTTLWGLGIVAAVLLILLGLHGQHWIAVHLGMTTVLQGPYYNFWSGFGSDIAELAIFGSIIQVFHHSNCHVKRCWRFGKPVDGTPYRACHKHHPDHEGTARNVSLETILQAHRAHKETHAPNP